MSTREGVAGLFARALRTYERGLEGRWPHVLAQRALKSFGRWRQRIERSLHARSLRPPALLPPKR